MACHLTPEELRFHYDEPGNKPISRAGHLAFRDDLIRILRRLKTKTITGTLTVTNLAVGDSVDVFVDHSDTLEFCMCEHPYFTALDGIEVIVFEMIDISGTAYATSGTGFCIRITNVSQSAYTSSFDLSYSRTGFPA